jgi:hypothetical protein
MQYGRIKAQVVENSGPVEKYAALTSKTKQFDASPDDIEGERWHRGRVSRDLFAFNGTVILPVSDVSCFHHVTLLSRKHSRLAWLPSHLTLLDAGKSSVCLVDLALRGIFFFA